MSLPENYNVQVTITTTVYVRGGKVIGIAYTEHGWSGDSLYVETVDPETGDTAEVYPLTTEEAIAYTKPLGKWEVKVI